jgi:signal peptidase I
MGAGLAAQGLMLLSVVQRWPHSCVLALVSLAALSLSGTIVTAVSRPASRPRRPWLVALSLLVVSQASNRLWRAHVAEGFSVPAASMEPSLLIGDHFFLDKVHRRPSRGEVIVFRSPHQPEVDYVKRVVGLPGDVVAIARNRLVVNGEAVPLGPARPCEAGAPDGCELRDETLDGHTHAVRLLSEEASAGPFVVPAEGLFVLGDNRDESSDSRAWGSVPLENVKGRVSVVHFSLSPAGEGRWERVGTAVP